MLRKFFLRSLKLLGFILGLVLLYFIAAFSLSYVTVNSDFSHCEKDGVEIYLRSNGVHTDIVLPLENNGFDWSGMVKPEDSQAADSSVKYAAFGWGDKGFYLNTPEWSDLKFSTAFNALFYLGSSAMHVSFYKELRENENCRRLCISKKSYLQLCEYISESFSKDTAGRSLQIESAAYGYYDAFYEARGKYSLFYTCNTWANEALKSGKLKACLWTPFDWGILDKYR